jgi:hypothetical protein
MPLYLVAGIDFPSQLPTATAPYFLLGLNCKGYWVLRETTGRRAGLFRTREAAIKYACHESPDGNFTILGSIANLIVVQKAADFMARYRDPRSVVP